MDEDEEGDEDEDEEGDGDGDGDEDGDGSDDGGVRNEIGLILISAAFLVSTFNLCDFNGPYRLNFQYFSIFKHLFLFPHFFLAFSAIAFKRTTHLEGASFLTMFKLLGCDGCPIPPICAGLLKV